jgi:ribosomal protein S18 acetylase RimI-like enzyme
MTVEIVPMRRRHIAGFREVLDEVAREGRYLAFLEAPPLPQVRRFVLNNLRSGAPQIAAVDDDVVIGWCDITPRTHTALRHSGVLGMGLAASHRGLGIGTRLLAAALEAASLRSLTRIELVVRTDNAPAIALYRRYGFEIEGTCRAYLVIDGCPHDALLMARLT